MIKQVIVIRRDLKMRRGKEIAQGAHASLRAYLMADTFHGGVITNQWSRTGETKIVLQVSSEVELLYIYDRATKADLPCSLVKDEGRTEFGNVPTITAMAIGPYFSEQIDDITAGYELY